MIYYANGCSYTWGGGLYQFDYIIDDVSLYLPESPNHPINIDRLHKVYTHHLGKLIGAEKVINESLGGGSNYRIVRKTLEYFNNLILNDQRLDNHFVTIQWTEPARFHYYDPYENSWVNFLVNTPNYESLAPRANNYLLEEIHKYYYKNLHSAQNDFINYITHVTCLGNFFKMHNIPYLFFKHSGWDTYFFNNNFITEEEYIKLLNQFNWVNNDPVFHMQKSHIEKVNNSHPSEMGHQQWAEILFNDIKRQQIL